MTGGDSLEHPNDLNSEKGPGLSVMVFAECDLTCVCCHIDTHQIHVRRQGYFCLLKLRSQLKEGGMEGGITIGFQSVWLGNSNFKVRRSCV